MWIWACLLTTMLSQLQGILMRGGALAAVSTRTQMLQLVEVQNQLHETVRASALRAESAHALVDFAVATPSFTVRTVERALTLSYGRANALVGQLVDLKVLQAIDRDAYQRRFYAPSVLEVLLRKDGLEAV